MGKKSSLDYPIVFLLKIWTRLKEFGKCYITPNEPAIKPIKTKKENSDKSLGRELTIRFNWVILPCAPQVEIFIEFSQSI